MTQTPIELNGTTYAWPARPVAVICVDGSDPAYFDHGLGAGIIPNIQRCMESGFHTTARGSMPSFTCPNNMSIVTGVEPCVHGISGNFYLDRETGEPVVMTGPELLRTRSVMAEFSRHGAKVASITAKDKLRKQLQKDMDLSRGSVSFSTQHADQCTMAENGIENVLEFVGQPLPDMYSAELSLFVLDAGIKLIEEGRAELLYLSLTDFIQHAYAPGETESDAFYRALDDRVGRLVDLGAVVGLVADHGMADKADANGEPKVVFLGDVLDEKMGSGACTVICPITDAFVGHHGALGGFVRVYVNGDTPVQRALETILAVPGVEKVLTAEEAAVELETPLDREGDLAVLADAATVIGGRAADHDLSALKGQRLRTHGSTHETAVPFVLSEPLNDAYAARAAQGDVRSHEIFDYALNGAAA